ncbi:MAG TPA: DNA polymerase III subunit gamma/tau [Arenimonas sp.]|nr:DNA polymerase III subunit gamma/tau [Arenimonas sp.]
MSYLVLARKWRPRRFAELVGQQHVVRALTHALETGRVHHAFLFTGTRGVGKTTIARIFAKSLNCETGTTSDPCGVCGTCLEIDNGRYPDLIEIDAASHTGVDNIRDLIENAQYMPSRGRVKVYLIDEVHMLSKPAFNALLKTLEEPPDHVKFLLATTDPEKLPVTVLSRCLQFNLRRLDQEQIGGQIRHILSAEGMAFDEESVLQLAVSADGSLRDGLSLLDQAIAYTGGTLQADLVRAMLGTVDRSQIEKLLTALCARDGDALMTAIEHLAAFSPDFGQVLDRLAESLHEIQLAQLVPGYQPESRRVSVSAFAQSIDAQVIQLWYQMAVMAKKDLYLAPSARMGFEMGLLRMLAFLPADASLPADAAKPVALTKPATSSPPRPAAPAAEAGQAVKPSAPGVAAPTIATPAAVTSQAQSAAAVPERAVHTVPPQLASKDDWLHLLKALSLRGPEREIGLHAAFVSFEDSVLKLAYPENLYDTLNDIMLGRVQAAISQAMQQPVQIRIDRQKDPPAETLFAHETQTRLGKMQDAEAEFQNHPVVTALLQEGGQIVPDSIKPLELK